MCGIAGIVGPEAASNAVERMTARLKHRGPDRQQTWRGEGVHLGHTRLSIIDLSAAGNQPYRHGPLTLTYNGEIYNFRELRKSLEGPFRSDCDTEVLVRLYERDRERCLNLLQGMFSFAIWDADRGQLFAARDRLGIKPFYYRELPGGIAFASEIKALLELGRPKVDVTALRDYFTYKYIPEPKSIYSGIRQLPPGCTLTWDGSVKVQRYWEPAHHEPVTDMGAATEELGALLNEIVPAHTLADVPVAVFLSGGIDSTTLAAHLDHARTFTLGSQVSHRDEAPYAREIAKHLGTDHTEATAESDDLDRALATIPAVFDEPFGDSGAWSTYLVSGLAAAQVKVALSGEGGDELFSGYHWYSKWPQPPSRLAGAIAAVAPTFSNTGRSAQRRSYRGLERYAAYLGAFTAHQRRSLIGPALDADGYDDLWHFRQHWREDLEPIKRLQWIDLNTFLPGDLLAKVDRSSMAHSLEVRPPLLDHRLVEFALAVDSKLLRDIPGNQGKLIVRNLMESRLPPGFFDRPKKGFNLPIRRWVQESKGALDGALDRLADARVIRRPKVTALTNEQTWSLMVLDSWLTQTGASW